MDKLRIVGGTPLHGKIRISGAKNAALPLMCAALLTKDPVVLSNIPYLKDVTTMANLLAQHGVTITLEEAEEARGWHGQKVALSAAVIDNFTAPYEIVRTMRASVLVLGPLLARFGRAKVSLPGGCAIGTRPVDLHLKALEQMGASITLDAGYMIAEAPDGLRGAEIGFEKVSVGATENILMAATLAKGTTILRNAAREPEIGDLARLLIKMGAQIEGLDSDTLTIIGQPRPFGADYQVIADRIEAGSFMCMVGLAGGDVDLEDAQVETNGALIEVLRQVGLNITKSAAGIRVSSNKSIRSAASIETAPFPEFPTDMQAQIMALLSMAEGTSEISETTFENRYMHVPELQRLGANIMIQGNKAVIKGVKELRGAEVMATDLRASMSLIIAALAAKGETIISRVYHLDRGYERLEEKLSACGAKIERSH